MQGARPMVETRGLTDMQVVVKEIMEGKIEPALADETAEADEDAFPV